MNNKGEVTIMSIVIACLMFMVFLTAGLQVTTNFFSYSGNSNGSSYNATYFTGLENGSLEKGNEAKLFLETTTGMSDDVFQNNGSVGTETPEDTMNRNTLTSLTKLPNIYTFVKNVGYDATEKLGIPGYFLTALTMLTIIIIIFGTMKALRGIQ